MPNSKKYKWQEALSTLLTDPKELIDLLQLDTQNLPEYLKASLSFPLKIPRAFVDRIEKGNPRDPLLLQLLPHAYELREINGYDKDPLQELKQNPLPGLLHKYHGRVLVTLTSTCAIHCRYCFRRHFPYQDNQPGTKGWQQIINYIKADTSITEVILSGGDPLTAHDHFLTLFTNQLKNISHIKTLRIHSRVPIVLPERITDEFLEWIKSLSPWQIVLVIHANHAREINNEVDVALSKLKSVGVTLLNQSVLLRHVNDEVATLVNLSYALFAAGVLPYYLHLLDKVEGAHHFDVALRRAKELHAGMMATLPGYLVPKLAVEEAGGLSKTVF